MRRTIYRPNGSAFFDCRFSCFSLLFVRPDMRGKMVAYHSRIMFLFRFFIFHLSIYFVPNCVTRYAEPHDVGHIFLPCDNKHHLTATVTTTSAIDAFAFEKLIVVGWVLYEHSIVSRFTIVAKCKSVCHSFVFIYENCIHCGPCACTARRNK